MMILQSLQYRSMHGYALVQHIQRRSDELLNVEEGSLYPALQRMLKSEWLEAAWETSPANRKVRTYSITAKGKEHLTEEITRFEAMLRGIQLVLSN